MHERVRAWFAVFATFLALSLPSAAVAQVLGTVAGNVKDASGAVLPGVTVEVSSPALIEKVRTAVSGGNGQYQVVNLPPGIYTVTFSLPGFATVRRDALEVSVNFTSNVDAEMKVGSVEETVTVTGESPIVDIQSAADTVGHVRELQGIAVGWVVDSDGGPGARYPRVQHRRRRRARRPDGC